MVARISLKDLVSVMTGNSVCMKEETMKVVQDGLFETASGQCVSKYKSYLLITQNAPQHSNDIRG